MHEQTLEKYAEIAVKIGVNIQPGQTLVINAPIAAVAFTRLVVKMAYEAQAKHVHVEWNDEQVTRIKYDCAPLESFHEYPLWRAKGYEQMAEDGAAFLSIVASNPDLLQGVDPDKIAAANRSAGMAMQTYREYIQSDQVSWCVLAVPSPEWAAKVFPTLPQEQQVLKLWQAIFDATRANVNDPVESWDAHRKKLEKKAGYLNQKRYKALHYEAPGTDLSIELSELHIWASGGSVNRNDVSFVANIPTEEVFTTPLKEGVNGTVYSTKPLNYGGTLIENFSLTFKKGRIVSFTADSGYETLERLIATDEGAHYLGEVALVPHDSPISNTNTIFFNTLFDENASNHLAIGNAYAFCLEGGKTMSKEELKKHGANDSIVHVDFMIGSAQMNIVGETTDGKLEPIFRNGNWAF